MTPAELEATLAGGTVLLDLRPPRPFAAGHVPGALNLQFNRADLVDRVELLLPPEQPLAVHAEPEPIARVAVDLLREGGFAVTGHLGGGLAAWKAAGKPVRTLPVLSAAELHAELSAYRVLDVREAFEYRHGHVPGARPFPSSEAWEQLSEVPDDGRPIAVICGDQTRSAAVASMLLHAGRDARLVMGGMVDWLDLDLPVERQPAAA
jgi:rhodanese-related sulfurtransferase